MANKIRLIRKIASVNDFNAEYLRPDVMESGGWLGWSKSMVYPWTTRHVRLQLQIEAFEQGLIPYIPNTGPAPHFFPSQRFCRYPVLDSAQVKHKGELRWWSARFLPTPKGTIVAVLDYPTLRAAVEGSHVAVRCRTELQPAGGPGDKVFPSTYGVPNGARTKYATEEYRENGETMIRVLLDSVASGANRHEVALQEALDAGEISFPNPFVDFTIDPELADLGRLSALQAPHRLADAIFRDSLLNGTLFRLSDLGRRITESSPNNATALFLTNPVAELMGMWDSTGPKGGLGSKFQRAFVSEIVGLNAQIGVKVGSRIDPLQIERTSAFLYKSVDPQQGWTLNPAEALINEKGKPTGVGSKGELGRPSAVNHGNIAPSIDAQSGGVTIEKAVQTTVISLAALRKLRFPTAADGSILSDEARRMAELEARTALAAIGVVAIAYQRDRDYDLRSRCLLVPTHPAVLELVPRDGSAPLIFDIDAPAAARVLAEASAAIARAGLAWPTEPVRLVPAPKLIELIKRSRDQLQSQPADAGGAEA